MSRREDIWSKLGAIDPTAKNLFSDYNDAFNYNDMAAILDKIGVDTSSMMTRNAGNTVQRGQKDTASRLAAEGITGGSVYNNQINKVTDSTNQSFADALEQLGLGQMGQRAGLMQTANENKFRSTSANQNVLMQNILNVLNKNQAQQGAVNDWEQMDLKRDDSEFNFFKDMFPGLVSAAGQVGAAALMAPAASDLRVKKRIKYVGMSDEGIPIIEFNYINNDNNRYRGVLAQQVREVKPQAVIEIDGIKHVDYSQLSVKMEEVANV